MELNNRGVREAQAGRFEEGAALLRRAVAQSPGDLQVKKNLSGVLTDWAQQIREEGGEARALSLLEEAYAQDPSNAKALLLLGDSAYSLKDDLVSAVRLWKEALAGVPSSRRKSVLDRISQAERDLSIERKFQALRTEHFQIRFEGSEGERGFGELAKALEGEHARLKGKMGSAPSNLAVIVYSGDSFHRIAGRADWSLGLYDGRIRMRLEDIGTERMLPILSHELAHAFLHEVFGPRVPVWVHEGFAQVWEPERPLTPADEHLLERIRSRSAWVPLKWLDRRFRQPSNLEDVDRAYAQSKWAVSRLLERFGFPQFRHFLEGLKGGQAVEKAFDRAFAPLTWARADAGNFD